MDLLRISNFVVCSILFIAIAVVMISRWRHFELAERLFALGFIAYIAYGASAQLIGILNHRPLTWATIFPTIANLWIIAGAVIMIVQARTGKLKLARVAATGGTAALLAHEEVLVELLKERLAEEGD